MELRPEATLAYVAVLSAFPSPFCFPLTTRNDEEQDFSAQEKCIFLTWNPCWMDRVTQLERDYPDRLNPYYLLGIETFETFEHECP
jgi:hypothetical protein